MESVCGGYVIDRSYRHNLRHGDAKPTVNVSADIALEKYDKRQTSLVGLTKVEQVLAGPCACQQKCSSERRRRKAN